MRRVPLSFLVFKFEEEHRQLSEDHIAGRKRTCIHLLRCIEQKAQVPRIDTKKWQSRPPMLANAAQHRSVTTHHADEIRRTGGDMPPFQRSAQCTRLGVRDISL